METQLGQYVNRPYESSCLFQRNVSAGYPFGVALAHCKPSVLKLASQFQDRFEVTWLDTFQFKILLNLTNDVIGVALLTKHDIHSTRLHFRKHFCSE